MLRQKFSEQQLLLQDYLEEQDSKIAEGREKLFSKFSSELVCACLHELLEDLSKRMVPSGKEAFDI